MAKPAKQSPFERALDRVSGARLCYGEPVQTGGKTVIPVSRVRVSGGWGWGRGEGSAEEGGSGGGGGGGGHLDAQPLGFIEISAAGTTYHEIPDPERTQRMLKAGAAAIATLATGLAGARRLRGGRRRSAGLLRP